MAVEPGGAYAWSVLALLALIYVQNQWSRYSLNYMYAVSADDDYESIRDATDLNAADYGILTGYGFSATFCLAGLAAGRLADVASRKYVIFVGRPRGRRNVPVGSGCALPFKTWIVRGGRVAARPRHDVNIPWRRVVAPPRPRRG